MHTRYKTPSLLSNRSSTHDQLLLVLFLHSFGCIVHSPLSTRVRCSTFCLLSIRYSVRTSLLATKCRYQARLQELKLYSILSQLIPSSHLHFYHVAVLSLQFLPSTPPLCILCARNSFPSGTVLPLYFVPECTVNIVLPALPTISKIVPFSFPTFSLPSAILPFHNALSRLTVH